MILSFHIPDITCQACVQKILNKLQSEAFKTYTISASLDAAEKILHITADSENQAPDTITQMIQEAIEDLGFDCEPIKRGSSDALSVDDKPIKRHSFRLNWFLGSLGTGLGLALLTLSFLATGGLPFYAMVGIGISSSLMTLVLGAPFYYQAGKKFLASGTLTMDTLFTISTLTVIVVSTAAFVYPWLPMMFDASLLILGFRHLGLAIEHSLTQKITAEKQFKDRLPKNNLTLLTPSGLEEQRPLSDIQPGDVILLQPGKLIPVDGEAIDEASVYDTIVSGALLPKSIQAGEKLLAGMRLAENSSPLRLKATPIILTLIKGDTLPANGLAEEDCWVYGERAQTPYFVKKGALLSQGLRLASKTTLSISSVSQFSYLHRLDHHTEQAQFEKAPIEEATTQLLQYFIPTMIGVAILSGGVIGLFFPPALAIQCAISVLVAACPCTLGLITPLAVKIGMNKAASYGVQFKSAKALQAAAEVDTVVLDVNGTLTTGVPEVTAYRALSSCDDDMLFSYFAAAEQASEHPFAKAITQFTQGKPIKPLTVVHKTANHSGVKATIETRLSGREHIIVGNQAMMETHDINIDLADPIPLQGGQSVVYLARNQELLGYMVLTDPLRPKAVEMVHALKQQGKRIYICTGADKTTALRYAHLLGLPEEQVRFGCVEIPQGGHDNSKTAFIKTLQQQGHHVAMVGDSGNDAAALTQAFGIAIYSKSSDEMTRQQASAVIHGKALWPVVNALTIAHQTVANIKQNLSFSLAYNVASVLVAGGLLLALGLTLNPGVGVALMVLQTGLILSNTYRFKQQSLPLHDTKTEPSLSYVSLSEQLGRGISHLTEKKPTLVEPEKHSSLFSSKTVSYGNDNPESTYDFST